MSIKDKLLQHYKQMEEDGYYSTSTADRIILKDSDNNRKSMPVYSGVLKYFPYALKEVSKCSRIGNEQHNPGKKLHWDRSKSGDELDALTRHLLQAGTLDTDGLYHDVKIAWRALANLQKLIEKNYGHFKENKKD